eukprot:Gb_39164 [translate_table: standard]
MVVIMPGFPNYQLTLSGLLGSANLAAVSRFSGRNWQLPDLPNGNPDRGQIRFNLGKHKACRPNAYGMLNAWETKSLEDDHTGSGSSKPQSSSSDECEHDLAAMVHDFIENGSSDYDSFDAHNDDHGVAKIVSFSDSLQVLVSNMTPYERDLHWSVSTLLLSVNEADLFCYSSGKNCNGDCIRHLLVKYLRRAGYNAAFCKAKWHSSGTSPGGEYEYMDVVLNGTSDHSAPTDRIIIDIDFRSQLEIARPVAQYQAALNLLPTIFVGKPRKLKKILRIMCDAAKCSLQSKSMHIPPWRTFEYMLSKWFSTHERTSISPQKSHASTVMPETNMCRERLRHLKAALKTRETAALKTRETGVPGLMSLKSLRNGDLNSSLKQRKWY